MNSIIMHATKIMDTVFFISNFPPKKYAQVRLIYIRTTHTLKGHENTFFTKKFCTYLYKVSDYYPPTNWHGSGTELTWIWHGTDTVLHWLRSAKLILSNKIIFWLRWYGLKFSVPRQPMFRTKHIMLTKTTEHFYRKEWDAKASQIKHMRKATKCIISICLLYTSRCV